MTINPPAKSFTVQPEISNLRIAAADPPPCSFQSFSSQFKAFQSLSNQKNDHRYFMTLKSVTAPPKTSHQPVGHSAKAGTADALER
jgi:hypothetical protein